MALHRINLLPKPVKRFKLNQKLPLAVERVAADSSCPGGKNFSADRWIAPSLPASA
jgi:hypothetical protein